MVARGKVRARLVTPAALGAGTGSSRDQAPERPDGSSESVISHSPRAQECFFEEQPDACATIQEGEDAVILAAELEAEIEGYEQELEDAEEYCNMYGCEGTEAVSASGPSLGGCSDSVADTFGCGSQIAAGFFSLIGAATARWGLYTLGAQIAAGAAVATSLLAVTVVGAVAGVASLAWAAVDVYKCVYKVVPAAARLRWPTSAAGVAS